MLEVDDLFKCVWLISDCGCLIWKLSEKGLVFRYMLWVCSMWKVLCLFARSFICFISLVVSFFVCLVVCVFICLCVCLFVCLSVCLID